MPQWIYVLLYARQSLTGPSVVQQLVSILVDRHFLHLIAAEGCNGPTCEKITNLLGRGALSKVVDKVLQWIALRYATQYKQRANLWWSSSRNKKCKTTELEFIRKRVYVQHFIGKITVHIAGKNYSLLLQYLASICSKRKWAPLVDAAVISLS